MYKILKSLLLSSCFINLSNAALNEQTNSHKPNHTIKISNELNKSSTYLEIIISGDTNPYLYNHIRHNTSIKTLHIARSSTYGLLIKEIYNSHVTEIVNILKHLETNASVTSLDLTSNYHAYDIQSFPIVLDCNIINAILSIIATNTTLEKLTFNNIYFFNGYVHPSFCRFPSTLTKAINSNTNSRLSKIIFKFTDLRNTIQDDSASHWIAFQTVNTYELSKALNLPNLVAKILDTKGV